ncbi:cytosolic Fe-S cluster assembly factor nubp2 [Flavobacteriaceae bacterium UJ101]|nr:cytosolic Fe-S cluster assembly factor nubp2 [Flavobacteriaceae bacterium UJ101]
MKITKDQVLNAIKLAGIEVEIRNVNIFGDEVEVDVVVSSPTMHVKKKIEVNILKAVHDFVYEKAKVKTNFHVNAPEKQEIKGTGIPGVNNIIAVASGKGGVGKSTVSSNLAVALAQKGFRVGLLDADIYGPSAPTMFDLTEAKPLGTTVDGVQKIQPVENYGVKVLSLGFFAQANQAVVWRGAMASKAIHQLIRDAHWGDLDFLVLDLPPGTGDIHLSLVQEVPITGAVIVSTPQTVALADARKGVAMFQLEAINVPVLGMIENMAYFTPDELPNNKYYLFGKDGARNLAEDLKVPFLGEIPIVQSIREAGDIGRPAALQDNTLVADKFDQISKNIVEELVKRNKDLPPTEAVRITTMAGCSSK